MGVFSSAMAAVSRAITKWVHAAQDRIMAAILSRGMILYNVAWEDPRIDEQLLSLGPEDAVLVLTTGGCNVLDRMIDGPASVVSVDLNPAQNALLELKLVALQTLSHEQFFQLFALSNRPLFEAVYVPQLRPRLTDAAAAFWDSRAHLFDNLHYAGAAGGLARVMVRLAHLLGLGQLLARIRHTSSLDEQRAVCGEFSGRIGLLARVYRMLTPLLCPFAGVPASQLTLQSGIDVFTSTFHRVLHRTHVASDNYFYHGYFYGQYTRTNCPRYLRREHFDTLKEAAASGRVQVHTALLKDVADRFPDGHFTAMILLDHMDWLSTEQIVDEWATLSRKLHPTRGRVLWRSFSEQQHIAPLHFLEMHPGVVAAAERKFAERVGTYNATFLATLPPGLVYSRPDQSVAHNGSAAASFYRMLPQLRGATWLDIGGGLLSELPTIADGAASFSRIFLDVPDAQKTELAEIAARRHHLEHLITPVTLSVDSTAVKIYSDAVASEWGLARDSAAAVRKPVESNGCASKGCGVQNGSFAFVDGDTGIGLAHQAGHNGGYIPGAVSGHTAATCQQETNGRHAFDGDAVAGAEALGSDHAVPNGHAHSNGHLAPNGHGGAHIDVALNARNAAKGHTMPSKRDADSEHDASGDCAAGSVHRPSNGHIDVDGHEHEQLPACNGHAPKERVAALNGLANGHSRDEQHVVNGRSRDSAAVVGSAQVATGSVRLLTFCKPATHDYCHASLASMESLLLAALPALCDGAHVAACLHESIAGPLIERLQQLCAPPSLCCIGPACFSMPPDHIVFVGRLQGRQSTLAN